MCIFCLPTISRGQSNFKNKQAKVFGSCLRLAFLYKLRASVLPGQPRNMITNSQEQSGHIGDFCWRSQLIVVQEKELVAPVSVPRRRILKRQKANVIHSRKENMKSISKRQHKQSSTMYRNYAQIWHQDRPILIVVFFFLMILVN